MRRSIYLLVLLAASLLPGRAGAAFIPYDDPARWGAAAQFFTTENFDGVTPEVHHGCGASADCGAGTFVLTDFDIQTPNSDVGWSIGPDGFGAHLHGVFRCVDEREESCYFDIIFDRPISAIGLYLEGVTQGPGGGPIVVPPAGIDVFVGASAFGEPFFKPDADPFLGLVSDTAFSQIHFVLHDVPAPPFNLFLDRFENATLSRVDYRFAVPEPATLALLATAFAAMSWARRRVIGKVRARVANVVQ